MKWIAGHLFDGWNNLRYALAQMGESIDRAMDVWEDSE